MAFQKKEAVDHYVLNYIKSNCPYAEDRDYGLKMFRRFAEDDDNSVLNCVVGAYYYKFPSIMEENGMFKLALMIAGMLYQIEQNEVDHELAYVTYCDITDFEEGDYAKLMTEQDLKDIRADIATLKQFYALHPEYMTPPEE